MATIISHTAIPIAGLIVRGLKKIPARLFVMGVLLSMAPDLDVIGFRFDVSYESVWGHRGFTHSLLFAALIAGLCSRRYRFLRARPLSIFIFLFISMASHGVLDAFTNGGLGVAFFWPLSGHRYFFPWHGIAVSPIGVKNFFTERAWMILQSEIIYIWLPCLFFAFLFRKFQVKKQA